MGQPHIVILGGGPAGCGGAFYLQRQRRAQVTLIEREAVVGGNAGSFLHNGLWLDYGSHRLHPACDATILADIRSLIGDDLVSRARHGRIRLRGRWLHFPIRASDLLLHLDRRFALGMLRDMMVRALRRDEEGESFVSVLRANVGATLCDHFYVPYARKLWGRAPEDLSGLQARKRVSAASFGSLLRRLVHPPGDGRFYYPREGYGQISRAYADAARSAGADLLLGWSVTGLAPAGGAGAHWRVTVTRGGEARTLVADHVWSTVPLTLAARLMEPPPPADVLAAAEGIDYRAMVLVYLELDVDRFTTTDAHYFPEADVSITRVSEPKNYFGRREPVGRTALCAELPCAIGDRLWTMSDVELGRLVAADLGRAGIPLPRPPIGVFTRRLGQAYPVYPLGYERRLERVERWLGSLPGFLTYGRQGLFAHDNTHHALYMAYCAAACQKDGGFDEAAWAEHRRVFATHVVED